MLESSSIEKEPTLLAVPSQPEPPRYWWLRRLTLLGVLLVLGVAGLRWWWGHEAQRRIDAIIADAHRRGEPILPGDFVTPGRRGPAKALLPRGRIFAWSPAELKFADAFDAFNLAAPPNAADRAMIRGMMKAHAGLLARVRAARGLIGVAGDAPLAVSDFAAVYSLSGCQDLSLLLDLSAVESHAAGNDAEALEYIRDMGTAADAATDGNLSGISYLVAGHITYFEAEEAIQMADALWIARDGSATPTGAANRAQVQGLIAELADGRDRRAAGVRMWEIERSTALRGERDDADSQLHPAALAYLGLPIFHLARVRQARELGPEIGAARQAQYPAAIKMLPTHTRYKPPLSILQNVAAGGAFYASGDPRGMFRRIYAALLTRRVAATALAIRLYAADHDGHPPETLPQLVPQYLPGAPIDPFAADGRSLRYLPHRNPPVIYSVGENGTDEGGAAGWTPGHFFRMLVWHGADVVFPLRPATTAPTSAPAG
ncbi:MAG TPA: hypothetical protein VFC78_17600 [Tepidisphaeraceae bacterium]|nr:hypothetical protein [Tepidisphaeraceae bacterium]